MSTLNEGDGLAAMRASRPDMLVSVGAPEIFKPPVLATAAVGAVNVHNGRLPRYRGMFGTFWEMYCGEQWGCATLHVMEPRVDAGAVLAQSVVRLAGRTLHDALVEKKREGGRLLAWLTRIAEAERQYPAPCPHNGGIEPGYFGWPTLGQIAGRRLRRRHARVRDNQAVKVWPPEWRADAPAPDGGPRHPAIGIPPRTAGSLAVARWTRHKSALTVDTRQWRHSHLEACGSLPFGSIRIMRYCGEARRKFT